MVVRVVIGAFRIFTVSEGNPVNLVNLTFRSSLPELIAGPSINFGYVERVRKQNTFAQIVLVFKR